MRIDGKPTRTIWLAADGWSVEVIDQTKLPHRFEVARLTTRAEAAHDNGVPFYVGAPSPSIDFRLSDGVKEIPIEERDGRELSEITARTAAGDLVTVTVTPEGSPVGNWGFDVTPARLVTGLITERGICPATEAGLKSLFPEAA